MISLRSIKLPSLWRTVPLICFIPKVSTSNISSCTLTGFVGYMVSCFLYFIRSSIITSRLLLSNFRINSNVPSFFLEVDDDNFFFLPFMCNATIIGLIWQRKGDKSILNIFSIFNDAVNFFSPDSRNPRVWRTKNLILSTEEAKSCACNYLTEIMEEKIFFFDTCISATLKFWERELNYEEIIKMKKTKRIQGSAA